MYEISFTFVFDEFFGCEFLRMPKNSTQQCLSLKKDLKQRFSASPSGSILNNKAQKGQICEEMIQVGNDITNIWLSSGAMDRNVKMSMV